jgi:hypothetical protein
MLESASMRIDVTLQYGNNAQPAHVVMQIERNIPI